MFPLRRVLLALILCVSALPSHADPADHFSWTTWVTPYVSPGGTVEYDFDVMPFDGFPPATITLHLPAGVTYSKRQGYGDCVWTIPAGSGGDVVCKTTFSPYQETEYWIYGTVASSVPVGSNLAATMTFDFGSYVSRVLAHTLPELLPSIAVLRSAGFAFAGAGADPQEPSAVQYVLTRDAHQQRRVGIVAG